MVNCFFKGLFGLAVQSGKVQRYQLLKLPKKPCQNHNAMEVNIILFVEPMTLEHRCCMSLQLFELCSHPSIFQTEFLTWWWCWIKKSKGILKVITITTVNLMVMLKKRTWIFKVIRHHLGTMNVCKEKQNPKKYMQYFQWGPTTWLSVI